MATNNAINLGRNTFSAALSATVANATGDGTTYTIICDTELIDEGSCYNNATGIYTVPVTGNYHFDLTCALTNLQSNHTTGQILISNGATNYQLYYINAYACSSDHYVSFSGGVTIPCTAADQISFKVVVAGGSKVAGIYKGAGYWTFCSGYQLL
jgi:hypothetical protein